VLRYALSALVLFPLLHRHEGAVGLARGRVGWLAAAGAVGLGLNQVAFLLGIGAVSAGLAAILLSTTPLITSVVAALWAREPLRRRVLVSLTVSFGGSVVVIVGGNGPLAGSLVGGSLILLSATALGLGAVLAKGALGVYSALRVTTWMCLVCSLTLLPLGLPGLLRGPTAPVTLPIVGATAFTVLGATVLGNLFWNDAVRRMGATRTALYTYLQPIIGVLAAIVLLGERLTMAEVFGGQRGPDGAAAGAVGGTLSVTIMVVRRYCQTRTRSCIVRDSSFHPPRCNNCHSRPGRSVRKVSMLPRSATVT